MSDLPADNVESVPFTPPKNGLTFSKYQKFVVAVLAFLQFTIVLDFMIMAPLGAMLMPSLKISPAQFGFVVSVYAFSAGAAGLLSAGFADRFDRKKLLLFFYCGFIVGTLLCALSPNYHFLFFARMVTGLFGGVIGSIVMAITTDLFPMEVRGRVMGVVQTAFAASQVMGIPVGLYLANHFGWHAPFLLIVGVGATVGIILFVYLNPINAHLVRRPDKNPIHHFFLTLTNPKYVQAYATTALLTTGGFMIMPFSSAFNVNNLSIKLTDLPLVYMVSGGVSIVTGPLIGRMSDAIGKFKTFVFGSLLTIALVYFYTRLGPSSLFVVIGISIFMFVGISARIISSSVLMSAVPTQEFRGSFMSVSSSIQQISGGLAAALAGMIVVENPSGAIEHFDTLGNVVIAAILITLIMMYFIDKKISAAKA